jgi:hypothetical protein
MTVIAHDVINQGGNGFSASHPFKLDRRALELEWEISVYSSST